MRAVDRLRAGILRGLGSEELREKIERLREENAHSAAMERLFYRTFILCAVSALACVLVAVLYGINRRIVLPTGGADTTFTHTDDGAVVLENGTSSYSLLGEPLSFAEGTETLTAAGFNATLAAKNDAFCLALPENTRAENVHIENHYMDAQIFVTIDGMERSFLQAHPPERKGSVLLDAVYTAEDRALCLKLQLSDIYEIKSIWKKNILYIEFLPPAEAYAHRMVVQPLYEPEDEAEDGQPPAPELREAYAETLTQAAVLAEARGDDTHRIYNAASGGRERSEEELVHLLTRTGAEYYLGLALRNTADGAYGVGVLYNASYFINGTGNAAFAALFERNMVKALSTKAGEPKPCGETSILCRLRVPAAILTLGNFGNENERALLTDDRYRAMIADGVAGAFLEITE